MTTARKYQLTAKRKVLCSTLGEIILPTGTGKSYIQGMVIEQVISNLNPADLPGISKTEVQLAVRTLLGSNYITGVFATNMLSISNIGITLTGINSIPLGAVVG